MIQADWQRTLLLPTIAREFMSQCHPVDGSKAGSYAVIPKRSPIRIPSDPWLFLSRCGRHGHNMAERIIAG